MADLRWRGLIIALVGYAFFLRLIFSAHVELLPEEAYYWSYSRHLDIGYLDHPPLVAWLIRCGTTLFGNTEFGVRFGAICCAAVTGLFVYRLTRNVFDEASALIALAMSQILPYFFLSGMLMTPDAPLAAAWAASSYFLERALCGGRSRAWIGAGFALGLGLISKYSIGLLAVVVLVFMVVDTPSRRWFIRWEPYAGLLVAAAVFAPVVIWNAQHDWASFAFQTSRRLAELPRFSLHKLIGSIVILLTPTGLLALWGAARVPGTRSARLLWIAVWVPVSIFVMFSLRHEVKLDWTGSPWVAAIPLMAYGYTLAREGAPGCLSWLRIAWPATFLIMLAVYSAGFYHLTVGIPGLGYSRHIEWMPVEWRDFGRQVDGLADAVRAQDGGNVLVVGMDRYALASELAFYSRDQARALEGTSSWHLFGDMGLMYEQWFPLERQAGRTLLLVAWDPADLAAAHLESRVDQLGPVQDGVLTRDGNVVRRYYYRVARGYRSGTSG
jgi:dolichol-phosphate mannosyltransferase